MYLYLNTIEMYLTQVGLHDCVKQITLVSCILKTLYCVEKTNYVIVHTNGIKRCEWMGVQVMILLRYNVQLTCTCTE